MNYKTFEHTRQIREFHLDTFGHVNHAQYLVLLEDIRWDIIQSRGYGMEKIKETGLGPTILEVNCKFKRELKNRENIVIHSQCKEVKSKICYFRQEIFKQDGTSAFVADFTFALFDTKQRKLVLPSDPWLYALGVKEKTS